ncbi:MAG: hypothetical protein SPG13_02115 [Peptostreptococcus porci]|uniref:hypothetical protein n=1 Tax=Peptostreptococcus porci TaxID=2652282 RepID=UPI002A91BCBF|nr:hypothetical protein [Peptostreptococcus porci]MDY5479232.1 hypothetical protein [Peptostreptococcus porci]
MAEKCYCRNYVNVDVIFSIPGRIRMRLGRDPVNASKLLKKLKDDGLIKKGCFNSVSHTVVVEYENKDDFELDNLLMIFCGLYSKDINVRNIKLNYRSSRNNELSYSAILSLGFIILDLGTTFLGVGSGLSRYKSFIRWCAFGTTLGAIFEHGYKELSENGAFDPEVMSIMYLVNSIHKETTAASDGTVTTSIYSPTIAWFLTFGRHILARKNKSTVLSTVVRNDDIKVIEESSKTFFVNQFLGSCLDVYQNVSVRKSILR